MNMFITEYQGVNQSTTVLPCFYHTNTVIPCFLYSTLVYHVNIIVFEHGIHLVPWYLSNYHSFTFFFLPWYHFQWKECWHMLAAASVF